MLSERQNNLFWIDVLRVVATYSVIIVHVSALPLTLCAKSPNSLWFSANIYGSIVRFCVPVFVMISAGLILPKNYSSITEYLSKRVSRILYPFLFWSLIYLVWGVYTAYVSDKSIITHAFLSKYFVTHLKEGAAYHLWYIYMIIGLYLFFPVIGRWIRSASQTEIIYFICIWIATLFISMPLVSGYFPDFNLKYFTGYIGYAVLGYYLFYYQHTNSKKIKALSILMIIAGIAITYYGTYYVTLSNKELSQFYYGYLTPNVLLISVGVVILFKDVAFNFSARTNQIIGFFSKYSYGIYLAHLMVLWQLQALGLDVTLKRPVIGIPLTGILCMCISSVIVWLIHKLPYGKHVSG